MTGKPSFTQWIIDTGASHHMTGRLKHLIDIREVTRCFIGLPDGKQIAATKEGTVMLSNTLKLTHVLYVPCLNCNLISVSKLIDETNYIV